MKSFFGLFLAFFVFFSAHAQLSVIVHLDSTATQPLKGRLYVFSVTDTTKAVQDPDPFDPTPTFYLDVAHWKGGESRRVDATASAYPTNMADLKPGFYKFAAVLDIDTLERSNTLAPGNWYSKDVVARVEAGKPVEIHLWLHKQVPQRAFRETEHLKQIRFKSELVSGFRKRPSFIHAAVVLPKSYHQDSAKTYPLVLIIPGWGGTHYDAQSPRTAQRYGFNTGNDKIYVYLNPEAGNPFGLHAFIDSRVNGPWGKALTTEFIPWLLKQYRIAEDPGQHFLVGQSSGGYGVLWLQLYYPKHFGGCWAVSPDPIDFSNFVGVNLYDAKANLYMDKTGKDRPFFAFQNQYRSTLRKYAVFEDFLGDGGQMQSFEAVFGKPDRRGRPQRLFDRKTGKINPNVVKAWQPYDLGRFINRHYHRLAADLDGKIHVYVGSSDNFNLHYSVQEFKQKAALISDKITVTQIPDADHWSIWTPQFTLMVQAQIDAKLCAEKLNPACICTEQYEPVCGCNGKTYGNACMAECAGIKNYTKGECAQNANLKNKH